MLLYSDSFSASMVEMMFEWTTAVSSFDVQASKAGDTWFMSDK